MQVILAGDVPDVLKLTFADGTTEQIEVDRGRADEEFEDLRNRSGRYEGRLDHRRVLTLKNGSG